MKHRKRAIEICLFAGCLVAALSVTAKIWYSRKMQHTARVELSRFGGTYTLASAQRIRDTGRATNVISRFLNNPITEVDLSVDAWPRKEPGKPGHFSLVTDDEFHKLNLSHRLRRLSLRGMPITDASVDSISRLATLRHLDIRDTQISATGAQQLEDVLPNCKIHK